MSESVNAAQLAARKIKSAKGVKGKLGNRSVGSSGGFGANTTPSFTGQDVSSGGGLFGGALNAAGTFNFSAPVQGISFGNNSVASTPVWGSDNEEDRRADATAQELERRNKPFRMIDGSASASSQPSSSTFQRTPLSALSQPNGLGSVPDTAKNSLFQQSRSQSPAVPTFNFGATSSHEQQPATNIFTFGQTSQATPANEPFRFSTPPAVQENPTNNTFPFNQLSAQPVSTGINFGSTTATEKPPGSIFAFGQTSTQNQPSSSSMNFNSTAAPVQPTTNIFGNSTAPNSNIPNNIFGQLNQQSTSSNNVFSNINSQATNGSFGNQNQQATTPAKSLFGERPASTNSLFGSSNQQSAPTNNIFGHLNQASTSTSNLFGGQKEQPSSTGSLFGAQREQSASENNLFGGQREQSPLTGNLFGGQQQQPAPANNLFGSQQQQSAPMKNPFGDQQQSVPTNSLFSSQQQQSAPAGNLFGAAKSSNNLFGNQQPGTTSSIFANKAASTSTSSIFANQAPQSTSIFANLNKPTPQVSGETVNSTTASAPENVNGGSGSSMNALSSGAQNGGNPYKPPPSPKPTPATLQSIASPFASANEPEPEPESVLPSIEADGPLGDDGILSNLENGTPRRPRPSNLFSSMKPIDAPEDASQPAPSGMFPSLSQSTSTLKDTNESTNANIAESTLSPSINSVMQSSILYKGASTMKNKDLAKLQQYYSEIGEVSDSSIEEKCPPHFTDAQKIQFFAAYRIRSLNKGIQQYIEGAQIGADFSPVFYHYISRREEILEACTTGLENLKRKHEDVENRQSSPSKRAKPLENSGSDQHMPRTSSPLKTQPVVNSGNSHRRASPEKQAPAEALQPVMNPAVPGPFSSPQKQPRPEAREPSKSPLKKAQPSINGSTTPKAPLPSSSLLSSQQSVAPPSPTPVGKRKAEVQISKDHPTEEEAIGASQSNKLSASNGSKVGSATSSVFKSILEKPSQPTPASPEKKVFSLTKTQPAEKPRSNPFISLPMPSESPFSTSPSTKPSVFSSTSAPNIFAPKLGTQGSSLFPAKPAGPTFTGGSSLNSSSGETSTNLLGSETDTQASSMFVPKTAPMSTNMSGTSLPNPLASKEISTASNLFAPKSTANPASIFSGKPSSISTTPNIFAPKVASTTTTSASSSDEEGKIKPPTFGGSPGNFLAQFGQKSQKSMAEAEAEAMEKAKMEDMDSDEDEAEWEAKYKEKRAAEKKEVEEHAKSKRAAFVPGKGFTFGQAQAAQDGDKSAPKSIFSQTSATSSLGTNLFAPINRSEASSPGATSSRASSIFDGLAPPKLVSFGSNNIFGHLSDVDSGADSGKGNDADDDSDDEDSPESSGEHGDEKKDATYNPSKEDEAGPGTPVEETGPGIASAKKPTNLFNFGGSSTSGTSTPSTSGGSLFDRITKDPNGNPIRQIPVENKENAGPSGTSIFGGDSGNLFAKFGKSTAEQTQLAQDNTWKQDSPIKFGASTTSPPTVSVTAPTPTKPNQFAGLFGSNVPKSSSPTPIGSPFSGIFGSNNTTKPFSTTPTSGTPFAGLFGNTNSPKPTSGLFANLSNTENKPPAVGFNFGAASTTTSSLFPSSAGSTTTSRATSPGGTTDGESNNENIDPDAEHHEQIDLTSGGPGEENEEVLHQVRAKALKFESAKGDGKKNEWVVKGLGPLRVLKNKDTGTSRVLLRADPSGTIVLNKGILGNVTYTAQGKTLKLLTAGEGGQGLETWLLQVKTPAGAEELASILEANKRKDGST